MEIRSKATTKGYAQQSSQARRWRTTKVSPRRGGPLDRIRRQSEVRWAHLIPVERLTATGHQPADPSALLAHVVEPLTL
jgi:hypothetical protein